MNKLFVGLCASVCLLSLATDAQAVRLGGRTTIRPHRSYTPPPRTYRPAPVNPAIRGFNARQNAAPAGSSVPMPIFIPPIIAGHNTTQVTNDMYLIKTGMRKQGDKLQFWTLQNHSYTPDSKSAKVQFSMDCLARIYSPIALVTYPARANRLNPQPLIRSSDRLEKRAQWIVCTAFCVLNLLPSSHNI